jgi:hypothetical protein
MKLKCWLKPLPTAIPERASAAQWFKTPFENVFILENRGREKGNGATQRRQQNDAHMQVSNELRQQQKREEYVESQQADAAI